MGHEEADGVRAARPKGKNALRMVCMKFALNDWILLEGHFYE